MVLNVGMLFALSTVEGWHQLPDSLFWFYGSLAYISSFMISVRLFDDPAYRKPTQTSESRLVPIGEGKDCWFCKNEIPSHVKSCPHRWVWNPTMLAVLDVL